MVSLPPAPDFLGIKKVSHMAMRSFRFVSYSICIGLVF